jgi:transcriptional regulator with XRE-family HTH domain
MMWIRVGIPGPIVPPGRRQGQDERRGRPGEPRHAAAAAAEAVAVCRIFWQDKNVSRQAGDHRGVGSATRCRTCEAAVTSAAGQIMKAHPLRGPRGRKAAWMRVQSRKGSCRDCPLGAPSERCLGTGKASGRCGDWVWFVRNGKQLRRRWVKPKDPCTPKQRRCRARLGSVSAAYSDELTEGQQKACIAKGAKRPCRPRLGPSGNQTGQQYWVHKELKGKTGSRRRKKVQITQVPRLQALTTKFGSEVPQRQALTRTTWEPHRQHSGDTPAQHRPNTPQRKRDKGRMEKAEGRRKWEGDASEVLQNQRLTTETRCRGAARGRTFPVFRRPRCRRRRGRSVVVFAPQHRTSPMFGTFVRELRARRRLGLREFCQEHGHDPSNWSKIEREVVPPPHDEPTLRAWAKQLGLKPGTDDWLKFFDYAAVGAGRIPDRILADKKLTAHLPALFRILSGHTPLRKDQEKLLAIIQGAPRR